MKRIIGLIVLMIVLVGCGERTDYETEGPFVVMTYAPAGPDHVLNLYARHISIDENGILTIYTEPTETIELGEDPPIAQIEISEEEVNRVKELIERSSFSDFEADISDMEVMDGSSVHITVHWSGESKRVGGWNPSDPAFTEIADYIFELASDEIGEWEDEIEAHIEKMNLEDF